MGIIKIIIGLIVGGFMISKLESIDADKKLSKPVQAIIGLTIGVGVWFILTLFGL